MRNLLVRIGPSLLNTRSFMVVVAGIQWNRRISGSIAGKNLMLSQNHSLKLSVPTPIGDLLTPLRNAIKSV